MPKLNSTVKAVRVDNDKLAELERRLGDRSINSWMNEQISVYLGSADEGENISEWKADLDAMLELSGIGFDEFMDVIYGWVCDGTIDLTDGVKVSEASWVTDLRETCHDLCIPVEKAVESACKALRKGLI